MQELIDDLNRRKEKHRSMSDIKRRDTEGAGGPRWSAATERWTARERIDYLVDKGSFLELGALNHSDVPGMAERSPADGLVAGLAEIDGRPVVVMAPDRHVLAGTEGTVYIRKGAALHKFAVDRGLPIFHIGEGGGLRMPDGMGSDGISERMMPYGLLRHGREVPLISSIIGDSFGGPTWYAIQSDFVVQVKGTCMAVAGPRMLEIATGEKVTPEELGGWEIHAKQTGQTHRVAEDEAGALDAMRKLFSYLPLHSGETPPVMDSDDPIDRNLDTLLDLVPTRRTRAYDMRKVIRVIFDEGSFFELKPDFGGALLTGLARLGGRVVGVVASQPMIRGGSYGPDEADKAISFIAFCDSYHIPLVFLHDVPGFRVGRSAEADRMASKIMVWNQAVAWSSVPKVSVVIRKSIGAAYSNMCGPNMGADFIVAWPTAEISFTGAEVGVNVVYGRQLAKSDNPVGERQKLLTEWEFDSSPYQAAAKHLLDDVIDPRETRKFLHRTMELACRKNGGKSQRLLANWPTGY
ncbi:acyl-CoA carboxylase subunit beta [Alicyclobacillus ferrooxydans]|nr:carboxyl transferase domain-containing protein [Alicyclobacillus ferrooxydans]